MSVKPRHVARWERGGMDRVPAFVEGWSPGRFWLSVVLLAAIIGFAGWWWRPAWGLSALWLVYTLTGIRDLAQRRQTIRRNFPVLGRVRYFFESVRPELRQYFVESDREENPFSREMRSVIYQRAKDVLDTVPFGTKTSVYADGYEWLAHSMAPVHPDPSTSRVSIGADRCNRPYEASIFNVSAMSYGSLSRHAVLALNEGARAGGFYHNTGEGGISPYHLEPGGDLVWQIGTGYFGCRAADGNFDPDQFVQRAGLDQVRMIELKISQGAKPAHGGILPGEKVTAEIASIRGVPQGQTVLSPPHHRAFDSPIGLLKFLDRLRELSSGKPVGFKLCIGDPHELVAIVKAMVEAQTWPDFITVDGSEGGTGAAPIEFSNSVGMPLTDGLNFTHNVLRGAGLRDRIRIISAGKIASGFHVVRQLALGADVCSAARAMMFALGCIQALKCNTNKCPTGIATQDPKLVRGLAVSDKAPRVASFHQKTVESVLELVGAAGLASPMDLRPHHVYRRVSPTRVMHLGEIYPEVPEGCLLEGRGPESLQGLWTTATSTQFGLRSAA